MKIHVRKIRAEGMDCEEAYPVDIIGLAPDDPFQFKGPIEVKAHIERAGDEVFAKVRVAGCLTSICDKCLDPVEKDWGLTFTLTFDAAPTVEFIEMDEDIRQEMILHLPQRILCRPDCRGLCPDCGVNLNKEACKSVHRNN